MAMDKHNKWMHEAISLAKSGQGRTRPNPPVGAVVLKNGRIVGKGYHHKAGGPHAEVLAIKDAGTKAKGATIYVTLEPCSTVGKTPPCVACIINSGIKTVVVSVRDPNPKHRGRGLRMLKQAGLEVIENVCKEEGQSLIAPFAKWINTGKPFVTLKLGMTLDGRIADESGKSKWITCAKSRSKVQDLRRTADAVMVGTRTACMDNPRLLRKGNAQLLRVIIDSKGKLPTTSNVLNDGYEHCTIIATSKACPKNRKVKFQKKGAEVLTVPSTADGLSLKRLVTVLGKRGLLHVVCEGGGELAYGLIKSGLVDEYMIFVAPRMLGGMSVPAVGGKGWKLNLAPKLKVISCESVGDDVLIRAK